MIDTPGGLLDATRDIVEAILGSDVPVVVYVAPEGAQAASAGTFVGAAADILAMAPTTNIGAASVVSSDGSDLPDTMNRKASKDAAAFIRSIAERRGRNAQALEDTVLNADAYSATEAVELGVADFVVDDYQQLIDLLNSGVSGVNGEVHNFDLSDVNTTTMDLSFLERLLGFISNPDIAFLLISLGGLGVIVELWNPGLWIPGTLGVLFLILGWATAILLGRGCADSSFFSSLLSRIYCSRNRVLRRCWDHQFDSRWDIPRRIFRLTRNPRRLTSCQSMAAGDSRSDYWWISVVVCF
jgi:membrane-bound serine protease (ClpP class)